MGQDNLIGLKKPSILLVEDHFLTGQNLRQHLIDRDYTVVGPVAHVNEGLALTSDDVPHIGVLDINILGGTSLPIAEALHRRNRPMVFVSGQAQHHELPEHLQCYPLLPKPVDTSQLVQEIHRLLNA